MRRLILTPVAGPLDHNPAQKNQIVEGLVVGLVSSVGGTKHKVCRVFCFLVVLVFTHVACRHLVMTIAGLAQLLDAIRPIGLRYPAVLQR
jgi:hypothetical protein